MHSAGAEKNATPSKGNQLLTILQDIQKEKEAEMPKKEKKPVLLRETETDKEKYCPACKAYHPAREEYFYKDGRSSTGFSSWCIKQTLVKNQKDKKAKAAGQPSADQPAATLVLDFSRHSQMMKQIQAMAEEAFHIQNVPDRSFILIHSGNFAGDVSKGWQTHVQSCVLLGTRFG